ncbi:sensor histidine kinase [Agrobacterium tumefaciens]|uniref:sensor histidine kinase n=1 Tax=Agrobacterium tumefaciens TaxID=358 RepID=UPI003BA25473
MTIPDQQAQFQTTPDAVKRETHNGDPVFGVVHDLGNLIQVAMSALNIVSRSPGMDTDSLVGTTIASARTSLHKAGALVQQTMRVALEGNTFSEKIDVWACLTEIEALVEATWCSNFRLELFAMNDLPSVTCNRVGLQSAILNLLLNARDAMPDGGAISIIAKPFCGEPGAVSLEIRVSDTGLGMSRDILRRAMDPYFTTKTSGLGGFGLPMVKRFAVEAGGEFTIDSKPGHGTMATLRLPATAADGGREATVALHLQSNIRRS